MNSTQVNLATLLDEIKINLSDKQVSLLERYINILLTANQFVNLTSITDCNEAMVKHIYDSLVIMTTPQFKSAHTVIDVGSGAGIPSIPLAISNPSKSIISLEATQKKVNFQIEASQQLGLQNLNVIWGRAEEIARQKAHREQYDLVVARAVAPLNILVELTIPFVRLYGSAIYYKGKEAENEIIKGAKAIQSLGAELIEAKSFSLPYNFGSRELIILQKTIQTSSVFPRKSGIPHKKPI